MENKLLNVKHEFIKEFPSSLESGRNRISPMPSPSSAMTAIKVRIETRAETNPIISVEYNRVANIQNKKPKSEVNPVPKIKWYAFLNKTNPKWFSICCCIMI